MAHNFPDLLAVARMIAVHRAPRADGLLRHKLASFQPLVCVSFQLPAFLAEAVFLPVLIPANQCNHQRDGLFFCVEHVFSFHEGAILAYLSKLRSHLQERASFVLELSNNL